MEFGPKYTHPTTQAEFVVLPKIPLTSDGSCAVDIYVRMPESRRYVRWLDAGTEFSREHQLKLQAHADSRLYCPTEQWRLRYKKFPKPNSSESSFRKETQELITDLYLHLLREDVLPEKATDQLSKISEIIVNEVFEDLQNYEIQILQTLPNLKNNQSFEAIRALCFVFAMANGYATRSAFMDITASTILMDFALKNSSNRDMAKLFVNQEKLPEGFLAVYQKHPAQSHFVAVDKFKNVTETALQMILNHHELHNGQGFPRRVYTKSLPELVKIAALAVDVYEHWLKSESYDQRKNLRMVLDTIREDHLPATKRRHDPNIIQAVYHYLCLTEPDPKIDQEPSL